MPYEYKAVGAPEKCRRRKGCKTGSDRAAAEMDEIIKAEAVNGWEYQRTDLFPVEEKSGWLGRPREVHRAILVFRRLISDTPDRNPETPRLKLGAATD